MPVNRIIFHIDFDSFFASVEQELHPEFRGKPLGVTATNGRNCIIASSREAKKLGIGTGSRVHDALRLCPDLCLTPAQFTHYWEVSKKFISICKDFSPLVEVFSIDELFMDVTLTAHLYGGVKPMIHTIKQRIRDEIGPFVTVSIGISHNKLLAKLGSGMKKPNGEFYISPTQLESVYRIAQLTDICGIGERIAARLRMMGIYNLLTLRKTSLLLLIAEFGQVEGNFLKRVGMGLDDSEIIPYTNEVDVKSVSRNYCLPHNEHDKRVVLQNIYELCEEVGLKLRRLKKKAKTGGVFLRGEQNLGGHLSNDYYFSSGSELYQVCRRIIRQQTDDFNRGFVRQLSVWAGNLKNENEIALPLFPEEQRREHMLQVIDQINERFGDHTIRNGFLLNSPKLTTVPNGYMADRYERQKLPSDTSLQIIDEVLVRSKEWY